MKYKKQKIEEIKFNVEVVDLKEDYTNADIIAEIEKFEQTGQTVVSFDAKIFGRASFWLKSSELREETDEELEDRIKEDLYREFKNK